MVPYFLDTTLYTLGRESPHGVKLVLLEAPGGKAVLLFTREQPARHHANQLPGVTLHTLGAEDFRAKEEFLRAALQAGAALLWLEPHPHTLEPAEVHLTQRALNYVLSFKNEASCL
jgi:hypothetical protein